MSKNNTPKHEMDAQDEPAENSSLPIELGNFPIVGIGASAGGLAAFEAFFSGMPAQTNPGMAFVLVQHLAPDHKSILTDLIRRYTRMQVYEVEDGMTVQPNCAYIIPPNRDMAFLNGALQLLEPAAPRGQRLPIDFFFRSLAQDQRERAICIVLSGTGSDGTLGARAIKGEGGMVMAQNPESTEYDGMPRSVLGTGLVDYELPPAEMPAQLIAYVTHAFGRLSRAGNATPAKAESALKKIFILLRAQTSHDFSLYKPNTIQRRIERRMAVHQIETMDGYVKYLQQTPAEVDALFHDLLIGVTNFFRDPDAFKVIEEQVFPKILANKTSSAVIRVWSPGCSTGEEAYSLAILLAERQDYMKRNFKVQIFATDIDSQAITTARAGLYPASIAADITPERLARFFVAEPDGGAYRIHKGIRDMLVFSEQNVIKDPPFSKLDLISCRNLLIYMSGELQKKLMPLFHYALNPGGFLFLGTSETVGEFTDMFTSLDRKSKLYQRLEGYQNARLVGRFLPVMSATDIATPRDGRSHAEINAAIGAAPLRELTEQALLKQVAPFGALVNAQGDILYLHGRSGMYLEIAPGEVNVLNILKIAREGLKFELSSALHKAASTKESTHRAGLRVKTNGDFTTVDMDISPVAAKTSGTLEAAMYLVTLVQAPPSEQFHMTNSEPAADGNQSLMNTEQAAEIDARIIALQKELSAKDEYLQTANEELETSNEELKSSNEEMQSVNEELQSTNEELETSKEELQSVNEELSTVNVELQTKVNDLSRTNNDMSNLLAGTGIATVFVDHSLRILRFTPSAMRVINLILSDVGRPVGHIFTNLVDYGSLVHDTQVVIDTLIPKEIEAQTNDGSWYTLRIQPYRTLDNVIEGAVITFIDITEMKKTQEALRKNEEFLNNLLENAPVSIYAIAADGALMLVNKRWRADTGTQNEQVIGKTLAQIFSPETTRMFMADNKQVLESGKALVKEEEAESPVEMRQFYTVKFPLTNSFGQPETVGGISMDVTERKLAEEALRKANNLVRLAVVVRDSQDAITVQDLDGRILAWNPGAVRLYGWSEAEAISMNVRDFIPQELRAEALSKVVQLSRAEILEAYHTQRITKDGTVLDVSMTSTALVNEAGKVYAIATTERARVS